MGVVPHGRVVSFALLLVVATVASRWPFRTDYLFDWDSANFALALERYDVTQHRPHPPGYPLYVAAARVLLPLAGDANAALVAVSLVFSVLAIVALYALGRTMYGETVGRWAPLLLLASVTFWSLGGVALSYTSLAFFSTLVALLSYRILFLKRDDLLLLAAVYALGGGFRPDLLLLLAPLFGRCLLQHPPRRLATALGLAGLGCAAWLAPTVALSGGPEAYVAALLSYGTGDVLDRYSILRRGMPALATNVGDTLAYTFYALYASALLIPGAAVGWMAGLRGAQRSAELGKLLLLLTWVAPIAAFYVIIHVGHVGYVFSFLPALLLAVARGWALLPLPRVAWPGRGVVLQAGIALAVAANVGVFLFHARPLTAPGLRLNDAAVAARLDLIRRQGDPEGTVLVSYESFKHLEYYERSHRPGIWVDVSAAGTRTYPLPPEARRLLLADESLVAIAGELPGTIIPLAGRSRAKLVPLPPAAGTRQLVYRPGALALDPAR